MIDLKGDHIMKIRVKSFVLDKNELKDSCCQMLSGLKSDYLWQVAKFMMIYSFVRWLSRV